MLGFLLHLYDLSVCAVEFVFTYAHCARASDVNAGRFSVL